MNDGQLREIESLLSALCDGTIDTQQLERLEGMLRGSAECRRVYLQYVDMHARLTAHPNLTTGIPIESRLSLGKGSATFEERKATLDDDVVVELARASLEHLARESERAQKRRRRAQAGRWLALTLVLVVAVVGWRFYNHSSVDHGQPVLRVVLGEATIETSDGSTPAQVGHRLGPGERLRLGSDDARAVLKYEDGTEVVVYYNSVVEVPLAASDVQLRLLAGTMEVDAAPQPKDHPLIFATDHARYIVLGTRFRLYREAAASRLELDEGKVRLQRQVDGKEVEINAGFVAVATAERTRIDVQPLASGSSQLRTTLPKAGSGVAFSSGGNSLATSHGERGLKTWKPYETTPSHACDAKVGRSSGLAFTDDTLVQLNANGKQGSVTLWRPGESHFKTISLPGTNVRSRALSPDGSYVAESGDNGTHVYSIDPNQAQPKHVFDLPNKGKAWCLSLSRSAKFAAAGFWDGTVRVYSLRLNEDRIVFEKRLTHTPTQIALSADANMLAAYTQKDGLLLIDLATGRQRSLWAGGAASMTTLKFTADGGRLMAGLNDRTARMWSVADGSALIVIDAGHAPHDIAWSSKQSLLATAAGSVKMWECDIP